MLRSRVRMQSHHHSVSKTNVHHSKWPASSVTNVPSLLPFPSLAMENIKKRPQRSISCIEGQLPCFQTRPLHGWKEQTSQPYHLAWVPFGEVVCPSHVMPQKETCQRSSCGFTDKRWPVNPPPCGPLTQGKQMAPHSFGRGPKCPGGCPC